MDDVLTAGHVEDHLRSLAGGWEYPEDTVDTFKAGGRDTIVTGIAVAWLPFTWALQRAHDLGCSLFVTHEPTYYDHLDSREELFSLDIPARRRSLIESWGMAVLRCHDLWDRHPTGGITVSWGEYLGLTELVASSEYARVYAVEPRPARAIAEDVANVTQGLGQEGVRLVGDADRIVERVCVGTGAISPYLDLVRDLAPDLIICSDDGMDFWRDGAFAVDGGPPIVVVHHGVSEEPGVARLAAHLADSFPEVDVHHISQRAMYEFIPPSDRTAGSKGKPADEASGG